MATVRLTFLVDTAEDARAVEGSAYATGGWVTVEVHPFWTASPVPAVVVAKWDKDTEARVRQDMSDFLPKHIRPI